MYKKILKLSNSLACCCLALGTALYFDWFSLFFFGEYPHPDKKEVPTSC